MSVAKQGIELTKLTRLLQQYCTTHLADTWDNVGLLVEPSPPHLVDKILVTNDLTEPVLAEAIRNQARLILSYHPPIFTPFKRLTQLSWKERIVIRCLENGIAVFSPHTGLDAKDGGINDWLLSPFALERVQPVVPTVRRSESYIYLRVPFTHDFGQFCMTVPMTGIQTDIPSAHGRVAEVKCPVEHVTAALQQLQLLGIPVLDQWPGAETDTCKEGYGRVGYLKPPLKLSDVISQYKALFCNDQLLVAFGNGKTLDDTVRTIGVCAGSGGSVFREERTRFADLLVTGELSHHERLDAVTRGTTVILAGHSVTERGFLSSQLIPDLRTLLRNAFASGDTNSECQVSILMASTDEEPGILV
ncbi:NIF3-like protein 1 [Clonorchis sinensis]|uniref:NIF3-like protein 1 n=1 Tax=Clonorchis sinensis TaxID=79923 RepID=H2KSK3_CLOSI|nr:NIF3-like protein 1 [Clonorchis sinensis]